MSAVLVEFLALFFLNQTLAVLNPLRQTDANILQDTDLAGPLAFALAFGGSLLLVQNMFQLIKLISLMLLFY